MQASTMSSPPVSTGTKAAPISPASSPTLFALPLANCPWALKPQHLAAGKRAGAESGWAHETTRGRKSVNSLAAGDEARARAIDVNNGRRCAHVRH